jgi:hypothetical protein
MRTGITGFASFQSVRKREGKLPGSGEQSAANSALIVREGPVQDGPV